MAYSRTLNHFTSMQELATIWASSTSYLVNQPVIHNNFLYRCAVAHTSSGSFQTDLAAGNWERVSSAENGINWASSTYYVLNQLVIESDKLYKCLIAHTSSGSFITDLQAGDWVEISASEAGVFNYVGNPDAEVDTSGWSTYADAAGSQPVDGTGGSPNIIWSRSTTTPLRGDADFNLVKDAANRQGQGVSYDFTIDNADLAKVLTVTFDYEILSGTYATGDLTVYLIQDPAGAPVVIQPAGYQIQSASVGTKMKQIATFQTASNVTSYRLCLHIASTSALDYSLAVDNVVVGPQVVQYGAPVTDWQDYTPTGSWTGGAATYTGKWRRVGDSIEVVANVATSAAPPAASLSFGLPTGLSIDESKIVGALNAFTAIGTASINDSSTTVHKAYVTYQSTTVVGVRFQAAASATSGQSNQVTNNSPFVFGAGDSVNVQFRAPILGWSSTVQMSNDTDTRVVAARYTATSGSIGTGDTLITFGTKVFDTHNAYSSGVYTVPVPGVYRVSSSVYMGNVTLGTTQGSGLRVYRATGGGAAALFATLSSFIGTGGANNLYGTSGSTLIECKAGDTLSIYAFSGVATNVSSTAGYVSHVNIERLSGPSAIAASETVAASYWLPANQSAGAATPINFSSKQYDTHGAVTTGASWRFTAPIAGKYAVTTQTFVSAAATRADLYKNSGANRYVMIGDVASGNTCVGTVVVDLLAGDYFDIRPAVTQTILGGTFDSASGAKIWVNRVGN